MQQTLLVVLIILFMTACQQTALRQRLSHPQWTKADSLENQKRHIKRLMIISTNDFHGNLDPLNESLTDSEKKTFRYTLGGGALEARYFEILKERYKEGLLKLDVGDAFSGTFISNMFYGEPTIHFYNLMQYDAMTLGNHEFDFGAIKEGGDPQGRLKENLNKLNIPVVNNNIYLSESKQRPKWPHFYPYLIKEVNGVKVGLIGQLTVNTPLTAVNKNIKGLTFEPYKEIVLQTSEHLRKKGAQIIVLMIHEGADCQDQFEDWSSGFESRLEAACDPKSPLPTLVRQLPEGTVDLIVSGHTHTMMAYDYYDTYILQAKNGGRYFSSIELFYDTKAKKLLRKETIIHPPTKMCAQFFDTTNDCYKSIDPISVNKLVPATYLGYPVYPVPEIEKVVQNYHEKLKTVEQRLLLKTERKIKTSMDNESELGTLFADAVRLKLKTQVALLNSGGVRSNIPEGDVTYGDLYKVAPFDNFLMTVQVTGAELKKLVQIGTSGQSFGIGQFSGLYIEIDPFADQEQKEVFKRNRVKKVTFSDGSPLKDSEVYSLGTTTFLGESGGDNYGLVFNEIEKSKKKTTDVYYRDTLVEYLLELNQKSPELFQKNGNYLLGNKSRVILENVIDHNNSEQ